jgi:hypothetical protein
MVGFSERLAKSLIGAALAVLGVAGIAQAQFFPPPGYYPPPGGGYYREAPPPGYYRDRPPPGYYRDRPPPGYYRRDPRAQNYSPQLDPYGFGPGYERRGNLSRICLTGRGPCAMEQYLPIGSGCRCKIDGLRKGGRVG